jgi:hypothetical protein
VKPLPVALIFATLSTTAAAHPGPHDLESVSAAVSHVVGSPDHASWLILGVTAVLAILAVKAAIRISSPEKSNEGR